MRFSIHYNVNINVTRVDQDNSVHAHSQYYDMLPDPPRPVTYTGVGKTIRTFMWLFSFFIFIVISSSLYKDWLDLSVLNKNGVMTYGEVTDLWTTSGKSTHYHMTVRYLRNGVYIDDRMNIGHNEYATLHLGKAIPVTYLPADSKIRCTGMVTTKRVQDAYNTWVLVTLLIAALGFIAPILVEWTVQRELNLLRMGLKAPATITSVTIAPKSGNYNIKYDADIEGRLYKNSGILLKSYGPKPDKAQSIEILYLRDNPSVNMPLYGFVYAKLRKNMSQL